MLRKVEFPINKSKSDDVRLRSVMWGMNSKGEEVPHLLAYIQSSRRLANHGFSFVRSYYATIQGNGSGQIYLHSNKFGGTVVDFLHNGTHSSIALTASKEGARETREALDSLFKDLQISLRKIRKGEFTEYRIA